MRTHDRVNDKVWSTSKVLGNLQRSKENLRVAQEDHGVSDCCVWLSFSASDRVCGRKVKANMITNEELDQQFGPLGVEPVDDILEKSEHVYVALP